jgi:CHRD domain-containing protein
MKRIFISLTILLALLAIFGAAPASAGGTSDNFAAQLNGADEAPLPRETNARGVATFKLNSDGSALGYTLTVANIENVVAAHIHCGAVGVAGPVGVTLFSGGAAGSGRFDGVLAQGTITAPDPGNACLWSSLSDVLTALESGNTYVNVHTNDGIAPANTGPGDFPGGEIRGQIK